MRKMLPIAITHDIEPTSCTRDMTLGGSWTSRSPSKIWHTHIYMKIASACLFASTYSCQAEPL